MNGRGGTPYNNNGGRGGPGGQGLPPQSRWRGQPQPQRPHSQPSTTHPKQEQGMSKLMLTTNVGSVGKWGISRGIAPMLKGKGLFQGGSA